MPDDLRALTVRELLDRYVAVLNELIRRAHIRTRNAPLGDLMETIATVAYRGVIEPNSKASFDLIDDRGRRIQVKARAIEPRGKGQTFSAFRSWDFEAAVFVLVDAITYDILWAREVSANEAMTLGNRREHTNSTAIRIGAVVGLGEDVTGRMVAAYEGLDA